VSPFAQSLAGILPAWRGLCDARLPVWTFLGRRVARFGRLRALEARLRCEACGSRQRCRGRIARGLSRPPRACGNAHLFAR
jgi:hypothetical protein